MSYATEEDIRDWRDRAVELLKQHGSLTPQELSDMTGEHRMAVVRRVRKYPNYFRSFTTNTHDQNKDRMTTVELVPALMVGVA